MGRRETRCGHPEVGVSVGLTGPYGAHIICGSDQRGRRRSGMSERSWLRRRPLLRPRLSLWIEGETTGRTEQSSMIAPLPPQWAGVRESACMPCKLSRFSHVRLLRPHRRKPTKVLCAWNSPGKNTGVGCHFLLQGIFPTQGSNPSLLDLLCWQVASLPLSPPGNPWVTIVLTLAPISFL